MGRSRPRYDYRLVRAVGTVGEHKRDPVYPLDERRVVVEPHLGERPVVDFPDVPFVVGGGKAAS